MALRFAPKRLLKDLEEMRTDPPAGCSASPIDESNLFVWNATITGPEDSPWEGGIYYLRLRFDDNYPDKPPFVRFTTPMFHPNVFTDGSICLDIIKEKWQPIYTVSSVLASIMSLLTDPNPSSPANPDAAKLYINDQKEYRKRVRQCAENSLNYCMSQSFD